MDERLLIVAARQANADILRAEFATVLGRTVGAVPVFEHFGWTWFEAPEGSSREAIARGLAALRRPAICVACGERSWTLELYRRDHPPVVFEPPSPTRDGPPPAVDLAHWESAFLDAEVPFDAEKIARTLTGEDLTPAEWDDSLGNLPRLLAGLGLGGKWDERIAPPPPVFRFSLGLLYLLMVLCALLLATIRSSPVWGLILTAIIGPACIRLVHRMGSAGARTSWEQVGLLAHSVGVVFALLCTLFLAYFGTVLVLEIAASQIRGAPGRFGQPMDQTPWILAVFPGAAAAVYVGLKLW